MIVTESICTNWQTPSVRFPENFQNFKYGKGKSKFAHLLENKHSNGSIENIMEILHITKKIPYICVSVCFVSLLTYTYIYIMKQNLTIKSVINAW